MFRNKSLKLEPLSYINSSSNIDKVECLQYSLSYSLLLKIVSVHQTCKMRQVLKHEWGSNEFSLVVNNYSTNG